MKKALTVCALAGAMVVFAGCRSSSQGGTSDTYEQNNGYNITRSPNTTPSPARNAPPAQVSPNLGVPPTAPP